MNDGREVCGTLIGVVACGGYLAGPSLGVDLDDHRGIKPELANTEPPYRVDRVAESLWRCVKPNQLESFLVPHQSSEFFGVGVLGVRFSRFPRLWEQ